MGISELSRQKPFEDLFEDASKGSFKGCGQGKLLDGMRRYFGDKLYFDIKSVFDSYERVEEIRLRRDRRAYFTVGLFGKKKNIRKNYGLRNYI